MVPPLNVLVDPLADFCHSCKGGRGEKGGGGVFRIFEKIGGSDFSHKKGGVVFKKRGITYFHTKTSLNLIPGGGLGVILPPVGFPLITQKR